MALELELKLTAICEDCSFSLAATHYGDRCGFREKIDEIIEETLTDVDFSKGWETERANYEDMNLYCPTCKKKRKAA